MEKLVRDNVPEIIKSKGEFPSVRIANKKEYYKKLKEKLREEVEDFIKNPSEEELVDIYEVMHAIYDHLKIDKRKLKKIREKKAKEKGKFKKRLILKIR